MDRRNAIGKAMSGVQNALTEQGYTPQQALNFARLMLTYKAGGKEHTVQITSKGNIRYAGNRFTPEAFARSNLARFVTGAHAANLNRQAIQGDPGYQQSIADLGLARDQGLANLNMQQQQQLIQFGDPTLAGADRLTAGAAGANPFSTTRLLQLQNQQANQAVQQNANRFGTLAGGGYQSGLAEQQRQNAGATQDAYTKIQQLLAGIGMARAQSQQAYGVGQANAYQTAYQNMLASGALTAAHAPNLQVGGYHYLPPPAIRPVNRNPTLQGKPIINRNPSLRGRPIQA